MHAYPVGPKHIVLLSCDITHYTHQVPLPGAMAELRLAKSHAFS